MSELIQELNIVKENLILMTNQIRQEIDDISKDIPMWDMIDD
jgi:hypothetical protein